MGWAHHGIGTLPTIPMPRIGDTNTVYMNAKTINQYLYLTFFILALKI